MPLKLVLRYDMRAPEFGAKPGDLYAACLEQCEWADKLGWHSIRLNEHHGTEDGYLPSPLALAAAVAARTTRLGIRIGAVILPLHNPLRVAEEAAVVDIISRGRLELIIGAGYVAREFAMFGRDIRRRAALVEEGVEAIKLAWTGEPFEFRGRTVRVTPRPFQSPRPRLLLGGSSEAAARRAARIADGFEPQVAALTAVYLEECARLGRRPGPALLYVPSVRFLHVADDPEAAWRTIAPYALHEANSYGAWLRDAGGPPSYAPAADAESLRKSGTYAVLTPDECFELIRQLPADAEIRFAPLMGGLDPELAWASLQLFADKVMPRLKEAGLL